MKVTFSFRLLLRTKRNSVRAILTVLFFVLVVQANGQDATGTESADSTNIYYQSLKAYLLNLRNDNNSKTIYIEKNSLTTANLPSKIGEHHLHFLDSNEIAGTLKKQKEIIVINVVPIRVKDADFFVNIIPFQVRKENKNLRYINSGGVSIHFKFDQDTGFFRFEKLKQGNI